MKFFPIVFLPHQVDTFHIAKWLPCWSRVLWRCYTLKSANNYQRAVSNYDQQQRRTNKKHMQHNTARTYERHPRHIIVSVAISFFRLPIRDGLSARRDSAAQGQPRQHNNTTAPRRSNVYVCAVVNVFFCLIFLSSAASFCKRKKSSSNCC